MLENRVTVVESMICSLFIQLDDGFFRLSEESSSLYLAYRLRYIFSKMASDLLALASDRGASAWHHADAEMGQFPCLWKH